MREEYLMSNDLLEIILEKGWQPIDVTGLDKQISFQRLEERGTAGIFHIGSDYLLTPIKQNGETLKDAYNKVLGLGPAIQTNFDEKKWLGYEIQANSPIQRGLPFLFSRLNFHEEFLGIYTPNVRGMPLDKAVLSYASVLQTFRDEFKIVTQNELDAMSMQDVSNFSH